MLKELYIQNLAVIKEVNISFDKNFNVFTGETGAGKSILINGINAILGERVSKDIVRAGCEKSIVSAYFIDISNETKDKLNQFGINVEDDAIYLSREIMSNGRSIARINSRAVNVAVLKEIGQTLINIHGQHDNQILLKPEKHIDILDSFGDITKLLNEYRQKFKDLQELSRKIKKVQISENEKQLKLHILNDKISEITEIDIKENEDVLIEKEYEVLKNSAELLKNLNNALVLLNGNDESDGCTLNTDHSAEYLLKVSDLFSGVKELSDRLKNASVEIDDISSDISSIISGIDISNERHKYVTERRENINNIKRKYGPDLKDVFNNLQMFISEREQIINNDIEIENLLNQKNELLNSITLMAKEISEHRKKACKLFSCKVSSELEYLNMPNVKLDVIQTKGKLTINGMDNIEFVISTNPGEPPKPIAKIASGGELSRIMLALKSVLSKNDNIPTLIFDEIDTGVSGIAAQKIGTKLSEISKHRQVLCVTHLTQIAVMANNHLYIEKNLLKDSTVTNVIVLDFEGRKKEIARIMGGDNITELMLKNAEELLMLSKQ